MAEQYNYLFPVDLWKKINLELTAIVTREIKIASQLERERILALLLEEFSEWKTAVSGGVQGGALMALILLKGRICGSHSTENEPQATGQEGGE